jgi:hypothetical protein
LGKVHLAVEESTAGELPGFGGFTACVDEPSEEFLLYIQTTMTSDFYGVFAREGVRGTKDGAKDFIKNFYLPLNTAEMNGVSRCFAQGYTTDKEAIYDGDSLFAGDTDDSYSARAVGR